MMRSPWSVLLVIAVAACGTPSTQPVQETDIIRPFAFTLSVSGDESGQFAGTGNGSTMPDGHAEAEPGGQLIAVDRTVFGFRGLEGPEGTVLTLELLGPIQPGRYSLREPGIALGSGGHVNVWFQSRSANGDFRRYLISSGEVTLTSTTGVLPGTGFRLNALEGRFRFNADRVQIIRPAGSTGVPESSAASLSIAGSLGGQ